MRKPDLDRYQEIGTVRQLRAAIRRERLKTWLTLILMFGIVAAAFALALWIKGPHQTG